jgi:MoaA/NifB/PqqE/SkfB family radical SAM enzyme
MDEETAFQVADVLRGARVRGVVISGGEPTLLPYLPRLVEYLSADLPGDLPGPRVVLSTNGLAPLSFMERVLPHLSWIALPIESGSLREHQAMRTGVAGHRSRVLGLLQEVRKNHAGVQVKLGTVITKWNVGGAARVLDVVDDFCLPDVWKIYQMSETNYAADNKGLLSLSGRQFEEVVEQCAAAALQRGVRLRVYRNSTRSGSYLFIDPDCRMVVIDDGCERRIGGLFDRPENVRASLAGTPLGAGLAENFVGTYPEI